MQLPTLSYHLYLVPVQHATVSATKFHQHQAQLTYKNLRFVIHTFPLYKCILGDYNDDTDENGLLSLSLVSTHIVRKKYTPFLNQLRFWGYVFSYITYSLHSSDYGHDIIRP